MLNSCARKVKPDSILDFRFWILDFWIDSFNHWFIDTFTEKESINEQMNKCIDESIKTN